MKSVLIELSLCLLLFNHSLIADDVPPREKGKMWEGFISQVVRTKNAVGTAIDFLSDEDSERFDATIGPLKNVKALLDKAAVTKSQVDLFAAVPHVAKFIDERRTLPSEVEILYSHLENLSVPLLRTAADHVTDEVGNVKEEVVKQLVWLFTVDALYFEANWEYERLPIDPAGIMILNPEAVRKMLMSGPWRHASRFVWDDTPAAFFRRYLPSGDGLEPLRKRFSQNRTKIEEEFVMLQAWVHQEVVEAGER